LQVLNLSGCKLNNQSMNDLDLCFSNQRISLEDLIIADNLITSEGFSKLMNSLRANNNLKLLNISRNEIANDLNDIIRQIGGLPSLATNNSKSPEQGNYKHASPDAKTFQASLSFSRELERLQANFDPAWNRYQAQGRLQAHRYLRGDDLDTIFDQWSEGLESATEIECVVLLDNSGSMNGNKSDRAYRSMYAIKKALDRINANTTVITFNSESQTLYRADEKATNVIRDAGAGGGNGLLAWRGIRRHLHRDAAHRPVFRARLAAPIDCASAVARSGPLRAVAGDVRVV
jgi:hypothetical protein